MGEWMYRCIDVDGQYHALAALPWREMLLVPNYKKLGGTTPGKDKKEKWKFMPLPELHL
jgi:hypothetical protein